MSRKILGVDIQPGGVSAVLVKYGMKGSAIEAHRYVPMNGEASFEVQLADAMALVSQSIDTGGCECIAAFPAGMVSYRNLKLPFRERKKIRQVLPFELETSLAPAVEDLVIDFVALKTDPGAQTTDLIAAAVEKAALAPYLAAFAAVNLNPDIVTVGAYPTAQCLAGLSGGLENAVLVDIGRRQTTLFVSADGQIRLIRAFFLSVADEGAMTVLGRHIRRTLTALTLTNGSTVAPEKVVVTGSASDDAAAMRALSEMIDLPVSRIDLAEDLARLIKGPLPESWQPHLMDHALALTLVDTAGLKVFNFRKERFAVEQRWEEYKKDVVSSAVLLALALVLMFAGVMIDSVSLAKARQRLDSEITTIFKRTFPEVSRIVDPHHQMRARIQAAQDAALIPETSERRVLVIDILNDLSKFVPKDVKLALASVVIGPDSVLVAGNTDTFNAVDDIKNGLEKADIFRKVAISSASMDRSGKGVRFKLKLEL